jgi:hypothetical protein
MKIRLSLFLPSLAMIGIVANPLPSHAQHAHLNAGATSTNLGSSLLWVNGADFIVTSGYVKTLDYTNGGRFAGYYQGGITPTALPATALNAGPDPAAAALGAFLQFSISSLEGPPGGSFGFWESGSTNPTLALSPGQVSTNLWPLTEGDGAPGSDPYGHIHGRRFTATKPGLYKIALRVFETSTNGIAGEPIHTPSSDLPIWFQAGVNVITVEPDFEEGHVRVRFAATAGFTWQLEASQALDAQDGWQTVDAPITGNDLIVEIVHQQPPGERRFYRIKGTPIPP